MQESIRTLAVALISGLGLAGAAHAQSAPDFRVSGFGTVGLVKTSDSSVEFIHSGQPTGAGTSFSAQPDSRLGIQLDTTFSPMFSATLQAMSKYNGKGNSTPQAEWLFGKARLSDSVALRVGRMGAPFFAVSDFREVGYANTWLRTPSSVYGQVFLRSFDGADLQYSTKLGGVPFTAQVLAGKTTGTSDRTDVDFKGQVGINVTAEPIDGVTLRAGTINGKLTVQSQSMLDFVAQLAGFGFGAVGDQINCTDRKASFSGVGVNVELGNFVGASEYTVRDTACYVPDTTGWHVMAGYRFGDFTPYVVVSSVKVKDKNVNNTIPASGATAPLYFGVEGFLNSLNVAQDATAIGLRWDAWRNVAVKVQYESVDTKGGRGMFRLVGPAPTGKVGVTSLAVDFVF